MPAKLILDTGPFVALIDRSEKRHAECVEIFEAWTGPILTTESVLTETLYLLGPDHRAQQVGLEFILRGVFHLVPSSQSSLRRVAALMQKYSDVPMDYADATVVALAEESETDQIFTLDHRGFSVFRMHGKRPLFIVP
jgi:uncharacterized protein